MKRLALLLLFCAPAAYGQVTAASCSTADVATAISTATTGQTVNIPSCPSGVTWTSGVTVPSTKVLNIVGAGSGRILAVDNGVAAQTVGTGTKTFTIAVYSPGFSSASISNGQTLKIFQSNNRDNFMQGTVTSLVGSTLTMNITSTGGSGTAKRWTMSTIPSTVIINNSSATLFSISEATTGHTSISGIQFSVGAAHACCSASHIGLGYTSGGQAVLIHDLWAQHGTGATYSVESDTTTRGVVWDVSADCSSYNPSQMCTTGFYRIKIGAPQTGQDAWQFPAQWGNLDTTGQNNFYVETSDFHTFQALSDIDDNGKTVFRYNFVDHAIFTTHGDDTSPYGYRNFEYYNNYGNFNCYGDGSTFNMANGWVGLIRGGSFVAHDNNLPALQPCTDYSKPDFEPAVLSLRQGANQPGNSCWGAGTAPGSLYYYPRQVGMGRVTGTGHDGKGRTSDGITYVGDSEPAYLWNNNRTFTVAPQNAQATSQCTSIGTLDTATNYVVVNRDYFFSAKPSYTPFTYPHPFTNSGGTSPNLSMSPSPANFGNVNTGSTFAISITTTNIGNATQAFANPYFTLTPSTYTRTGGTCANGGTLAANASCTTIVLFSPVAVGTVNGTLTLNGTISASDNLIGTGTSGISAPSVPTNLVASASGVNVTLTWTASTGTPTITYSCQVSTNGSGGPFNVFATNLTATTCPYTAASAGTYWFTVNATNAAGSSTNATPVSSVIVVPSASANFTPSALTFPATAQNVTSASQTIVLKNVGNATLNISSISISGPNAADFANTTTCGGTLAAAASCNIPVTFTPSATGVIETAAVVVVSNDSTSPDSISLSGIGFLPVNIVPTSLHFPNTRPNKTSTAQTVTFSNNSGSTVTFSSVAIAGSDFNISANACTGTLATASTCDVSVQFNPPSSGSKTGSLVFTFTGAGTSPQSVALSGTATGKKIARSL